MRLSEVKQVVREMLTAYDAARSIRKGKRERPDRRRELYFQQADGDMPADGTDFPFTKAPQRTMQIYGYHVDATSGTYSVQLSINGTLVGPTITQANANTNTIFATPQKWPAGQKATLRVTTSSSCEEFEAIFFMREV